MKYNTEIADILYYFLVAKHKEFFEYPSYALCIKRAHDEYYTAINAKYNANQHKQAVISCFKWVTISTLQADRVYGCSNLIETIRSNGFAFTFDRFSDNLASFRYAGMHLRSRKLAPIALMLINQAKACGFYDELVDTINRELNQ